MSIYEQLEYNFSRGYYSVVKNKDIEFSIFSTKIGDGFRFSYFEESVEDCKENIGINDYSKEEIEENSKEHNWQIIDTIHPSELMGAGIQVGDKVKRKSRGDIL